MFEYLFALALFLAGVYLLVRLLWPPQKETTWTEETWRSHGVAVYQNAEQPGSLSKWMGPPSQIRHERCRCCCTNVVDRWVTRKELYEDVVFPGNSAIGPGAPPIFGERVCPECFVSMARSGRQTTGLTLETWRDPLSHTLHVDFRRQ